MVFCFFFFSLIHKASTHFHSKQASTLIRMRISSKKKKSIFCVVRLYLLCLHTSSQDAGVGHTPKESLLPLAIRELAGSKHVKRRLRRPVVRRQTGRQRQRELLLAGKDSIVPFGLFRKEPGGWEEGSRLSKHHPPTPVISHFRDTESGWGRGSFEC